MKGIVKANTVDAYLQPIRAQLVGLIESKATVLELGCGTGDLLLKLSHKIKSGVGIDKSEALIAYARDQMNTRKVKNLEFKAQELTKASSLAPEVDYAVASLLFHLLPWDNALSLLEKMIAVSDNIIICGFNKPQTFKQKALLWFDQRFTSHYSYFRKYQENGFTEGLLNTMEHLTYQRIDTFDPVIKIYTITKPIKS